jgi:DNA-binding MarR family transcriptional regulator
MSLEEDIKQRKFKTDFQKAIINILFTSNKIQESNWKVFKKFGLTAPQFNVLRILRGQHPNPSTINLIIERMLDRMSNASRIVDKLEAKGLVSRSQNKHDRRAVDVFISDKGLDLLTKMDSEMRVFEENKEILSKDEAIQLNNLLDKLREGL